MQRELHLTFQLMQRSVIESLWTKVVCGLLPYQGYSPTIFRGRDWVTFLDLQVTELQSCASILGPKGGHCRDSNTGLRLSWQVLYTLSY